MSANLDQHTSPAVTDKTEGTLLIAAPNGARRGKADHPNLPITADEIAAEAIRCRDAGAAVLHLHVRDEAGRHTLDVGRYRQAIEAVERAVGDDLVIQPTTEAVEQYSAGEQIDVVRALKPEAVSIALREILPEGVGEAAAADFFAWMAETRVWAQIILYDTADIARFAVLHRAGFFGVARPSVLLVLGRYTVGQLSSPEDLDPMLGALAPVRDEVNWTVCAFGAREQDCIAHAIGLGGGGRVGFENNLSLPNGDRAAHTADLVALAAETARTLGRPPLGAADVRTLVRDWF